MKDILQEIKNVKSVMGSYIHINGVNEVNSDLPKIFLNKVQEIGSAIDRVLKVSNATKMHSSSMELKYDEAIIFVRPIDADSSLITFCSPDINKQLLNMTTGMLNNELKQAVDGARKSNDKPAAQKTAPPPKDKEPAPAPPKESAPSVEASPAVDVNKILHAGPLAKTFQDFQDSLALAIGPISEMVMKDTVEAWAKKGDCSKARLGELVEMLCSEIDDESLEAEFKSAVASHI